MVSASSIPLSSGIARRLTSVARLAAVLSWLHLFYKAGPYAKAVPVKLRPRTGTSRKSAVIVEEDEDE